jgi:hypothetical protein
MISNSQFIKERDLILRNISGRDEFESLVALARDLLYTGDIHGSDKKWGEAMKMDSTDSKSRMDFIKFCIGTGQTKKALKVCADILKMEKNNRDSLLLAACLLMSESRGNEASIYINHLL